MTGRQNQPIPLFHTEVSSRAIERVTDVLRSGWLNEGQVVKDFEAALTSTLGVRNPVTVNSGTAALHVALAVSGIGPGDEVIIPAQTFAATGLVVLMQGAKPVFADIDPRTSVISPASIEEKITPLTRAIIPVHWGGYPCDMDEINEISRRHNLVVIEDAAHALGASYRGTPIGAVSRLTIFSFQAIKHVTTGDGGMLCCLTEEDVRKATALRWFGIDRSSNTPNILGARDYDIRILGYKYHMNNITAAIGLGNLEDFPVRLERRRRIAATYRERLSNVPGFELLDFKEDRRHAYWLFTVMVDRREDFVRAMADRSIQTSVVDLRIDRNTIFGGMRDDLPGQAYFNERQISIPVHEALSDENVEYIVEAVRSGW